MKLNRYVQALVFSAALVGMSAKAVAQGIPVIDGASLSQHYMNVAESIQQGLTQLKQLQTQYDQYETQLRNTLAPGMYVWDQVNQATDKSRDLLSMVDYYKRNGAGDLERYLNTFKTPAGYRGSDCFKTMGCSPAEFNRFLEARNQAAEGTKHAVDSQVRVLEEQLQQIKRDSENLTRLQRGTEAAGGHMEAAQATNQLLSNQASQMLSIRSLMVAEQQAQAAHLQQVADKEAQQTAAGLALREGTYGKTGSNRTWRAK